MTRNEQIVALFRSGETYQQIGDRFGITRERVRQIVAAAGVDAREGGIALAAALRALKRKDARDRHNLTRFGCTFAQRMSIPAKARIAFFSNRKVAKYVLNATWQLTLWQWWTIWQESGHWHERGRGAGYWLGRIDTSKGFEIGNVVIRSGSEHMSIHNPFQRYRERVSA